MCIVVKSVIPHLGFCSKGKLEASKFCTEWLTANTITVLKNSSSLVCDNIHIIGASVP